VLHCVQHDVWRSFIHAQVACLFVFILFPPAVVHARISGDGLHLKTFGATGDGKHDDTVAFQRALDAAAGRGETVYVDPVKPGGGYVLTRRLVFKPGVSLIGAPAGMPFMAWEGVPRAQQTGAIILARPAKSEYEGKRKAPLFDLSGGNTVRGLYILYDRQPWPSDQEFDDPKSPYHYATDAERRARFLAEHVKPYGPTFTIRPGAASTTIEDITCGRYWDFFVLTGGGKVFLQRCYLYGFKRAVAMREAKDTVRIEGIHIVPNVEEPISWQHAKLHEIITQYEDNIAFDFGSVDGYSINDVVVFLAHTGMRLGTSPEHPFRDPLTGEETVHPWGQGPWGSVLNMKLDNVTVGFECVLGTILPNQLTNCMVHVSIAPDVRFPAAGKETGRQAAFVVESGFGGATLQAANLSVSSFAPKNVVASGQMVQQANGHVFLVDSPKRTASIFVNGLVLSNVPLENLLAMTPGTKAHIRLTGWTKDGEPQPDRTLP
jgi:hypothetical protein